MPFARLQRVCKRRLLLPLLKRFHPAVPARVGPWTLRVDLRDDIIGYLLYTTGEYEAHVQRLFAAMELSGATCIDVGANLGLHTLALRDCVGPRGRVIAFEPEPHNFDLLTENLRVNGPSPQVTTHRQAVGAAPGTCRLTLHPTNFGDHRVTTATTGNTATNGPEPTTVEVPIVRLDDTLADLPANAIRLIKIDVQGFEMSVLAGMTRTLDRHPDALLMVEVFPEALRAAGSSGAALVTRLGELGLTGWEFHEHRLLPVAPAWAYDLSLIHI
jgi:FkbM family methyltransferase